MRFRIGCVVLTPLCFVFFWLAAWITEAERGVCMRFAEDPLCICFVHGPISGTVELWRVTPTLAQAIAIRPSPPLDKKTGETDGL